MDVAAEAVKIPAALVFSNVPLSDCSHTEEELREIDLRLEDARGLVLSLEAARDARQLALSFARLAARYKISDEVKKSEALFVRAEEAFLKSLEPPSGDEGDVDYTQTDDYGDTQPFEDATDELLERADELLVKHRNAEQSVLLLLSIALNLQAVLQLVVRHKGVQSEIEDVCDEVVSQWEQCAADSDFKRHMLNDAALWQMFFQRELGGPYEALAAIVAAPAAPPAASAQ